jgi:hypothetical protein
MVDCHFFDMNAGKNHLTNVLFHIANSLLLFIVLRKTTGKLWQSGFVAALFVLHPLHVESVAWISERKDVLSTFFCLWTMLSYLWYVNHPESKRYLLTLFLFILGLMAKSMIITLPFVLLLIDYWPLCRFRMKKEGDTANDLRKKFFTTTLVFEKIPFLLIAAVAGLVAVFSQQSGNAIAPLSKYPIGLRITNALISFSMYIEKTIWPHDLAFFYPYQKIIEKWEVAAACLVLGLISFFSIKAVKRYPFFFVGWWWYIGTLIPVIGLVQIGMQARADRYTYIPLIGLFIIISWGFSLFWAEGRVRKIVFYLIPLVVIFGLTKMTWAQIKTWQNSITLSRHAINVTKNNFVAHDILADALVERHHIEEARRHYQEALKINPRYSDGYYNLANLFLKQNNLNEAVKNYYSALSYNLTMKEAHNNLGVVLARQGNLKEAIIHFQEALKIKPNDPGAMKNLEKALTMLEVNENQKK